MTSPSATGRCPDCSSAITFHAAATCATCGLTLTGPLAGRLWQVDQEIIGLDLRRGALVLDRGQLITALRPGGRAPVMAGAPTGTAISSSAAGAPSVAPGWTGGFHTPPARPEWTPKRVQNLLLGVGGLLLALAALVFAAVTYQRLGAAGRSGVLLLLTVAAGSAAPLARRRGLTATAETFGLVALALAALDAYGLRRLGLAEGSSAYSYAAGSAVALAVLSALYGRTVGVRSAGCAAVLLAQLPVPLLLAATDATAATWSLALAALAGADLAALFFRQAAPSSQPAGRGPDAGSLKLDGSLTAATAIRTTLLVALIGQASSAALTGLVAAAAGRSGAAAVVGLAALAVAAAVVLGERLVLPAGAVGLLALAALSAAADGLSRTDDVRDVLVLSGVVALVVARAAQLLPADWRRGAGVGSLLVTAATVLLVIDGVVAGLVQPLRWLGQPWSLEGAATARGALSPEAAWTGRGSDLLVLVVAALTAVALGVLRSQRFLGAAVAAALATATVALLPLGLDLTYPSALAVLLLLAAGLGAGGIYAEGRDAADADDRPFSVRVSALLHRDVTGLRSGFGLGALGSSALGLAALVLVLAAGWSSASRSATLVVVPLAAVLAALPALRARPSGAVATVLSAALAATFVGAVGAARGWSEPQVGGLLLVAVAGLVALSAGMDRLTSTPLGLRGHRVGAELTAAATLLVALRLAANDAGWLSWTLAAGGLLCLALALLPDRRTLAPVGALLLAASSWVRLAEAGVTAPEPYVVPLALLALTLGWLRRRTAPETSSWAAYSPGLGLALLPSLAASLSDTSSTRALLLAAVAVAVLLVGARERLQAPLVLGAAVLVVDAVHLLAPYAAALPRWATLAAAGLLLVAVGATYEQRRRDFDRLRARFDSLA